MYSVAAVVNNKRNYNE